MKSLHSNDYHSSAKRKLREFQRGKKWDLEPSQMKSKSHYTMPEASHTQRSSDMKSRSTQQLSNLSRSLQQMTVDPVRNKSPSSADMTRNIIQTDYSVAPPILRPSPTFTNSQAQQNAITVLAEDKMELQTLLRSEQSKTAELQRELLQLKIDRQMLDNQLREALENKANSETDSIRLITSQRELQECKDRLQQELNQMKTHFEIIQQEKSEYHARLEAANHNLTSCQAECSALSRQLEDAILVDKAYPVEGKNEKARKAAEDKMLAVNEENNLLRSQLGQMTNSLEKSIQNEERLDVTIQELKERMDQNSEHARQQYSQLQEQCRLLQAETERRVREGDEHRKRVREKEQELQALRASLEAGRMLGEERRENNMEKVHDKLVSLERERVRLTEMLENTRVTLSKTEQDLFDSQEQLADQRSMTEALRQERLRSSELAQETKELGRHLERIEVEKYDLQHDITRILVERDLLDQKLSQLQQASMENHFDASRVVRPDFPRSLSDTDISSAREERVLLEHRTYSPPIPVNESLQTAFDSLQVRFVQVMRQKADLDDRLQHKEKLLTLLEGETDTIGEYVSLYQTQRRALQIQYSQKQVLLDQLQVEKNSMQEDILRLRQLVQHLSYSKPIHGEDTQLPESEITQVLEKYPIQRVDSLVNGLSAEDTKQEIMTLLDRIDVFEPVVQDYHGIHMPCSCCTGSLLVV